MHFAAAAANACLRHLCSNVIGIGVAWHAALRLRCGQRAVQLDWPGLPTERRKGQDETFVGHCTAIVELEVSSGHPPHVAQALFFCKSLVRWDMHNRVPGGTGATRRNINLISNLNPLLACMLEFPANLSITPCNFYAGYLQERARRLNRGETVAG